MTIGVNIEHFMFIYLYIYKHIEHINKTTQNAQY